MNRSTSANSELLSVKRWLALVGDQLNFFRVHLLLFIVIPLLASLIFYWINDARSEHQPFVSFTDSLFLCISAATVAGLSTIVLSNINVGQQIILAVLTAVGSYSFVSTVMVIIRRYYFSKEMQRKVKERIERNSEGRQKAMKGEIRTTTDESDHRPLHETNGSQDSAHRESRSAVDLSATDMHPAAFTNGPIIYSDQIAPAVESQSTLRRRGTEGTTMAISRPEGLRLRRTDTAATHKDRGYGGFPPFTVTLRMLWNRVVGNRPGALPFTRTLSRRLNVPRTQTLQSTHIPRPTSVQDPSVRFVPYLTFDAKVGKNSSFQNLSDVEKEELGGVELRALNMLAWIVPFYWFGLQLLGFVILAPYMSRSQFRSALESEDGQAAPVNSTWFSLFQVISSYANNGILVDASMVPFQTAYLLLWVMIALILAGNTAFPVCLRMCIWVGSKCVPKSSQTYATLRFILDHPRRCFLYLFPSTQTAYLAAVVMFLNTIDWVLFLLLDIGNSPISSIPTGIRVMAGLFQAVAVRSGGFQIVPLSSLAPSVQVLYVVMMYVGALPLALGVRTTNVYEDRSIALFEKDVDGDEPEPIIQLRPGTSKGKVWGEYLAWHLKRQLSFDMWWLALAVFLICVFERGKILNATTGAYVNVFSIIFEVVSGYGTVGLSLGVPNQNFSLSGVLGTASKLVLCAVMLRGRHRGLPAAIDRSVLLPEELRRQIEMETQFRQRQEVIRNALHQALGEEDALAEEQCPPAMP